MRRELLATCLLATFASTVGSAAARSVALDPTAAHLEARLASDPDDIESRTTLLLHYAKNRTPASRTARVRHIEWFIRNAPAADIMDTPHVQVRRRTEPDTYAALRTLWMEHVESATPNPVVLGNAAAFFTLEDRPLAREILVRAASIDPGNPHWRQRLAALDMLSSPESAESVSNARRALAELEAATALMKSERDLYHALPDLAEAARVAGEDARAHRYATDLLRLADILRPDAMYGYAIHEGHRILGHVALNAGDVAAARSHLRQAGETPGSAVLNTFGPRLDLARALLAIGESAAVIDYLQRCSRFWEGRAAALSTWIGRIEAGEPVDLDRFRATRDPGPQRSPSLKR